MRLFRTLLLIALFASTGLSVVATPQPAHAQTSEVCDPATYGSDTTELIKALQSTDFTKTAVVADITQKLIQKRYEYEDSVAPAGCEASRKIMIQTLGLDVDNLAALTVGLVDGANKDKYFAFVNTATDRQKALYAGIVASLTATPIAATPAPAATKPCADSALLNSLLADFTAMGSGQATDIAGWGKEYVANATLRYKYEDYTFPAGCELVQPELAVLFGVSGDKAAMQIFALTDTANADAYAKFSKETIQPHLDKWNAAFMKDLDMQALSALMSAPAATPEATPEATAAK